MNTHTKTSAKEAYFLLKAAHDLLFEQKQQDLIPFQTLLENEEGIEEYVDREMTWEAEHHWRELCQELRQAEDALMLWAQNTVKHLPGYRQQQKDLDMLFERAGMSFVVRDKVIDLCLRLQE